MSPYLCIALALPLLCLVWFLLLSGLYHLVAAFALSGAPHQSAELAVWEFMFAFGAASSAVLLASRARFFSTPWIRRVFLYSLVLSSVLFVGHLSTGALSWLIHQWPRSS
jgi:cell division protein FtsW (lipid II flippase)